MLKDVFALIGLKIFLLSMKQISSERSVIRDSKGWDSSFYSWIHGLSVIAQFPPVTASGCS